MKKKKLLLASLCAAVMLFGCKKDDDSDDGDDGTGGGGGGPVTTCYIAKMVEDDTDKEEYNYDDNYKITKVIYTDSGSTTPRGYDTVHYDATTGNLALVEYIEVSTNKVERTWTYNWTGSLITSIVETGTSNSTPYTKTYTYSYASGKLTGMTTTGDPDGENMGFSNITYTGSNATSVDLDMDGTGTSVIKLTVTYDSKPNVEAKTLPREDLFNYFNANNFLKIALSQATTIDGIPLPAGTALFDNTYTYTAEGEVDVITTAPGVFNEDGGTETYTWTCVTQ